MDIINLFGQKHSDLYNRLKQMNSDLTEVHKIMVAKKTGDVKKYLEIQNEQLGGAINSIISLESKTNAKINGNQITINKQSYTLSQGDIDRYNEPGDQFYYIVFPGITKIKILTQQRAQDMIKRIDQQTLNLVSLPESIANQMRELKSLSIFKDDLLNETKSNTDRKTLEIRTTLENLKKSLENNNQIDSLVLKKALDEVKSTLNNLDNFNDQSNDFFSRIQSGLSKI